MNEQTSAQIKGMDELLYRQRHSAAHIMAEAVLEMFPEAKYAIGPPIENGFYYDFELPRPLTPDDLEQLDKLMRASDRRRQAVRAQRGVEGRSAAHLRRTSPTSRS